MTAAEWRRQAANVAAGSSALTGVRRCSAATHPRRLAFSARRAFPHRVNTIRPHEALAWNGPIDVDLDLADPTIPNLKSPEPCQLLDAGQQMPELGEVCRRRLLW